MAPKFKVPQALVYIHGSNNLPAIHQINMCYHIQNLSTPEPIQLLTHTHKHPLTFLAQSVLITISCWLPFAVGTPYAKRLTMTQKPIPPNIPSQVPPLDTQDPANTPHNLNVPFLTDMQPPIPSQGPSHSFPHTQISQTISPPATQIVSPHHSSNTFRTGPHLSPAF